MADYEFIRRLIVEHKLSAREVARQFHFSRRTVKAALEWDGSEDAHRYKRRQPPPRPKTGIYVAIIDGWLLADQQVHPKQRHTAKRIWQRLREEYGADLAETTVRQLVAQRRAELAPRSRQVFLMLTFQAGDLAQVDWGEAQAVIAGVKRKIYVFCMRLGYSTAPFMMTFPSMRMECFLAGHVMAFAYFGGVPRHIVYDNLSSAVKRILRGHKREMTARFEQLVAYYLFKPDFATPAAGWEKGLVEGFVGYSRRNYLVPVPDVSSYAALNEALRAKTLAEAARLAADRGGQTIGALWLEEKGNFLPLPKTPFRASTTHTVRSDKFSVIRYQHVRYSVPSRYAEHTLRLEAFWDHIEVYDGATLIAHHPIITKAESPRLLLEHYLDVLQQKPGAVRHARVVAQLGPAATGYRDAFLQAHPEAYDEFVRILFLVRTHPWPLVLEAITQAAERRVYTVAGVEQILQACRNGSATEPPALPSGPTVEQPDPSSFDRLLEVAAG